MECQANSFDLLRLPDVVVLNLMNFLDISSFRQLRLACSTTKYWVEEHSNLLDKWEVRIDFNKDQAKLIHVRLPNHKFYFINTQFCRRNVEFIEVYGKQIKTLKVKCFYIPVPRNIFVTRSFPNLTNLTLKWVYPKDNWGIKDFTVFPKIRKLSIQCVTNVLSEAEEHEVFKNFLKNFPNLDLLGIQVFDVVSNSPGVRKTFLRELIISYLNMRSARFKNIKKDLSGQLQEMWDYIYEIKIDLRDIKKDYSFKSYEEWILPRVKKLRVNFQLFLEHTKILNKLERIQCLKIRVGLIRSTLDHFEYDSSSERKLNHLKKLNLEFVKTGSPDNRLKILQAMFGYEDNKVERLKIDMDYSCLGETLKERMNTDLIVIDFFRSFKRLRDLTVSNWFSPKWTKALVQLERLEVSKSLPFDLIRHSLWPWDTKTPRLLTFPYLVHLTVNNCKIGDNVFKNVFRKMRLKSLCIIKDCDYHGFETQPTQLTKKGINFLIGSPFAETIEKFPYPWTNWGYSNLRSDKILWCCSYPRFYVKMDRFFSPLEFNQFKRRYFKFFKANDDANVHTEEIK